MTARELRNRLAQLRVTVLRGGGADEMQALKDDLLKDAVLSERMTLPHLIAAPYRVSVGRGHVIEWECLHEECLEVLTNRRGEQQRIAAKKPRKSPREDVKELAIRMAAEISADNPQMKINRIADIVINELADRGYNPPVNSTLREWIKKSFAG